ncbi:MAG TPA: diacylglycerol kinase [Anaerolineaceae bacterium]|uniref:Diacylglycerol kinase n=1 Tax=Anaerolinea thermophila TaxID=167964 RepID=A0A101FY56_9CHLR|nr:MAG: Diacylglycerol kinase [Anaerolinea thermophila]HAF61237.1 diacylglycerol kinase [Anaerolineaceae bacterium]
MNHKKYTLKESFKFAFEGFLYAIQTQRNLRFQLIVAVIVLTASTLLPMQNIEWAIIFLLISLVIVAEILNTAIEKTIDMIEDRYDPVAKTVKDLSAAAVLFIAMMAVVVGVIIYLPKFIALF